MEIESVKIHERNTRIDPYDENVSVWIEYDEDTQKYVVKYTAPAEYDEEECETKEEAIEKLLHWAENVINNIEWLTEEEIVDASRQIARIRIEYGMLGDITHYTHSVPEGTAIWEYGDSDIVIYEDRRGQYPRYHIYYEDGNGGETYEGFWTLWRAWIWATAIAENTIGYDPEKEKWSERAKEIRRYEEWGE